MVWEKRTEGSALISNTGILIAVKKVTVSETEKLRNNHQEICKEEPTAIKRDEKV